MPVPSDPVVQDIILQGMKEGGQYTVTSVSTAYTDFLDYQWETIKTEIWNACRTDKLLEVEAVALCTVGSSSITLPSDFDNEISLTLFDAPDSYRGTAQAGAAGTLTLASTFSATAAEMYGRYLFTLSGTGSGQVRQVTGYNDTTKVATVASNWSTTPDSTTTYLVGNTRYRLNRLDYIKTETPNQRPAYYSVLAYNIQVHPAGDKIYPVILAYRSNLTRLDDSGTVFTKHLRERRHLWVQGVKSKTMERYDDERRVQEKQIWEAMLKQYSAQNVVYTQMEVNR